MPRGVLKGALLILLTQIEKPIHINKHIHIDKKHILIDKKEAHTH